MIRAGRPAEESLSRHGRSFHWARRFLGDRQAAAATRLYSFCRTIDDLADHAEDPKAAKVRLRRIRTRMQQGRVPEPWLVDAMQLFRSTGIPLWIPETLIQGVEWDLTQGQIADERELVRYAYQVAGTVGLMMCRVLEVTDPRAFPHAIDLGVAMQLTNIARDVAEDARMGRRYLPLAWGPVAPLNQLADPPATLKPALKASVLRLLALADHYYDSGLAGLAFLPPRARAGILVAARVYQAIGLELRAREGRYWDGRVSLSLAKKRRLTAKALTEPFHRRSFWWRPTRHDAALHEALSVFFSESSSLDNGGFF